MFSRARWLRLGKPGIPLHLGAAVGSPDEPLLACDSLLVLAELGLDALGEPILRTRMLDLFVELPDRADELVEVALRIHAYGGEMRAALIDAAMAHRGGKHLGEVLVQVINRSDEQRRLRAVKVLSGCLVMPSGGDLLYTNDARVLVEILERELPNNTVNPTVFNCYVECLKALTTSCSAACVHRRDAIVEVLEDLRDDETLPRKVRDTCIETLRTINLPSR